MDTPSEAVDPTVTHTKHATQVQKNLDPRKTEAGGEHGHPSTIYSAFVCLMRYLPVIMFLVTALTATSAGLSAIQRSTMPNIECARLEALDFRLNFYVEERIDNQLHQLTTKRLRRNFIETYDECLARGLRYANDHFYGEAFHYPHVRNQTIDWVMENCGRLHHAPQVMQPSIEVKVLNHITRAAYRARRIAEMVVEFATLKAKALWAKIPAHCLMKTIVPEQEQPLTSTMPKRRLQKPSPRKVTLLPSGFRLLCKDASSCRIVYAKSRVRALYGSVPSDKVPLSKDAVHKALTKYRSLVHLHRGLDLMKSAATWLALLLLPLQLAGVIHWIVLELSSMKAARLPHGRQPNASKIALDLLRSYHTEQPIKVFCIATQILSLLVKAKPASTSARTNRIELLLGIVMWMCSQMMLLHCRPHLRSAFVELGRNATQYSNELRPIALAHFNEVRRRITFHPQELCHIASANYTQLRPIVLGCFNEMRRIASHPGELTDIVSAYYDELRRIAPEYYNTLSRSLSQYGGEIHGFFVYWLNLKARLEEHRRKNTTLRTNGNESETESESGGVVITRNEVLSDIDRNHTQLVVNGDNDTDGETDSDTNSDIESNRTPIASEDTSDDGFDTGSESDGSITPFEDEDEDWAILGMADA